MSRCSCMWIAGALVVLAMAVQGVKGRDTGVTCASAMVTAMLPCESYLTGKSPINVPCCQGVVSLNQRIGSDKAQIKSLCTCLKAAAAKMGVIPQQLTQIRQTCTVDFPVPIDPNVDCNSL